MLETFKSQAYYVDELSYDYVNPVALRREQAPPHTLPEFLKGLPSAVTELL